mgnify:CR=1 FL=1
MRIIVGVFCITILLLISGCNSVKSGAELDISTSNDLYTPPKIVNITDSIIYGPSNMKAEIHLINNKKAETYFILRNKFGVVVQRDFLLPNKDNFIPYAGLSPDFYHLEIYDAEGIILNGKFIHK